MALVLAGGLLTSASASARGLKTGFADDSFTASSASARQTALRQAADARGTIVRINVKWSDYVGSRPPANPTNPADPDYSFGSLDPGVQDARARGQDVLLTVYGAPGWAEGNKRPHGVPAGSWKPSPQALGQFAQALATRYSGGFHGLPRVRFFEAWTEPNLTQYLAPQWKGKKPKSPSLYRRLLNALYSGVKKAQPGATVIGGATAPFGDDPGGQRMRPLTFLKKLLCLNGKMKPTKCKAKPHLDVLSHHPINFLNSPDYRAQHRDDVEIADFHKVRKVLNVAERAKRVRPGGHHALWADEILWYTKPPTRYGVPVQKQARWLEEGLYLLWKQGASAVINFEVRDPKYEPKHPFLPYTGVFFHSGKKKPAFHSFRFPFVTHRRSNKKVGAWGKAPVSGKLQIQKKVHKSWKTLTKLSAHKGRVFTPSFKLRGHAKLRARIGKEHSLTWKQR